MGNSSAKDGQLKLHTSRRIAITSVAVAAVLGISACGGGDKGDSKSVQTSSSTKGSAANPSLPPVPTVDELNRELRMALDPSVPNSQKLDLVQGAKADPDLPNRLADAAKGANLTVTVTQVTSFGDSVTAKANVVLNGQANVVDVPFVAEDGKWKIEKQWACAMLTNLGQTSVACTS